MRNNKTWISVTEQTDRPAEASQGGDPAHSWTTVTDQSTLHHILSLGFYSLASMTHKCFSLIKSRSSTETCVVPKLKHWSISCVSSFNYLPSFTRWLFVLCSCTDAVFQFSVLCFLFNLISYLFIFVSLFFVLIVFFVKGCRADRA